MDPFLALVVAVLGASVLARLLWSVGGDAEDERLAAWRAAALAAELTDVEWSRETLGGSSGPLYVRFSAYADRDTRGTRITVSGPGLPEDLTVRPEGLATALRSARGAREIEIGHDAFDAAAWVQGSPAVVRAVLDAEARGAIRALFEGRLERKGRSPFWATGRIEEGVLRVDVPEMKPPTRGQESPSADGIAPAVGSDYVGRPERLPEVLEEVVALARRLAPPSDVARRLADNLKTEPVAGVRRQCLTALAREFPDHPAAREALLAAREDPDAEVRLRAGIALGPEGRETLLGVAGGEGAEDETTERAVAALGGHLTIGQAEAILRNALRTRREATARACLLTLGRRGGAEVVGTLAKVLAVEKPGLAAAAADALGSTGDASAERSVLAALQSPHTAVRVAAARALGRVGTVAAVEPLKEAESRDGATRAAARQAIAEIQARARGAAPGQLSLAGGEAGQLSMAGEEQGRLSLSTLSSRDASSAAGVEGSAVSARSPGVGSRDDTR
jgi:HEAT repeat protein